MPGTHMADIPVRGGTSKLAETSPGSEYASSIFEEACATSRAPNRECEDAVRSVAGPPDRSIGWMALCLEA